MVKKKNQHTHTQEQNSTWVVELTELGFLRKENIMAPKFLHGDS